ncbi:MAG: hypothetical protein EKK63_11125 [Acinetobacter sp.]|uniref:hypothetical protein n=1 Tax=Acinetobacter sp. TaxID=472 RepID=UPI000F922D1E|nr:hypothetical protein [Acinetobacter sp.]RUP38912.1 MAG: hypothetical protein EKK63_11125 [Acinetobacter sp.]
MAEVLPGIYDITSRLLKTGEFKWKPFGSRRGGITGRAICYTGQTVRRKSEIVYQQDNYAILKHFSYSYRSGQTSAAGMTYVPTNFELVRVDEGTIQSGGTLTILMTLECGHKWKQGIEFLKLKIQNELQLILDLD